MCRIAGIVGYEYSKDIPERQVREMCSLQKHGGPDGEGIYADEKYPVVFGHRRLSLIDLSEGGHQPMGYLDEQLFVTYNGELYNYLSLKEDLVRIGYRFGSHSDTEVILASYAAWGVEAFKKFAGMFAFALLDKIKGTVYLVRDQTGIKPLYFCDSKKSLFFASEVRAFQSVPSLNIENDNWQIYFMAYGHLPEPITTLKHVKPLPKGCYLEYSISSHTSTLHSYGHLSYLEKLDNRAEVISQLRDGLRKSVERHLISDAPIGAFLSGGIDSSLMALLSGEFVKNRLTTLSIFFNEGAYSEKPFQQLIAEKLKGEHQDFCLGRDDFDRFLPDIIDDMDLPSSDGINTWFISKYAKEAGLKAVLSGLGGDELFGGYPSFQRFKTTAYLQQLPTYALRAGKYSLSKKFKRLSYLSLPGIKGKYLFLRGSYIPQQIAAHLGVSEAQVWRCLEEQPTLPDIHFLTPKNQASWMEMHLYMQNQLLRDSDVMSMAHGIEIRVPFLDIDFVKLCLRITSDVKYQGGGKKLLTDSFADILPPEIYNRPKMGFSFPFKEWLAHNNWVRDSMEGGNTTTRKMYSGFLKGQYHWSQVLSLLLIQHRHVSKKAPVSYA